MGVAVADKATTFGRLEDGSLEDPEALGRAAQGQDGRSVNSGAVIFLGNPEQIRVRDVLPRLEGVCTLGRIFSGNRFVRVHPIPQDTAALNGFLIGYMQWRIVRLVIANRIFL
jgi:hypothetical protein